MVRADGKEAADPTVISPRKLFTSTPLLLIACLGAVNITAFGCSADARPTSESTKVAVAASSSPAEIGSWTDWSGYVQTKAWVCDWTEPSSHPHATCAVPLSEYVLVGGGADADIFPGDPIALTGSYPDEFLTTWNAESADHIASTPHRLRAFAIGLKFLGTSAETLRDSRLVVTTTSAVAAHPTVTAVMPATHVMVGGGAQALSGGAGQLLVDSHPAGPQSWFAASKDHQVGDPGTVRAIAIGLNVNFHFQSARARGAPNFIPSGPGASQKYLYAFSGTTFAPSSIGGVSTYNGPGRLLVELRMRSEPNNGAYDFVAEVWSQDIAFSDSGTVEPHLLGVRYSGAIPGQTFPGGPPHSDDPNWDWITGNTLSVPVPPGAAAALAMALLGLGIALRSGGRPRPTGS